MKQVMALFEQGKSDYYQKKVTDNCKDNIAAE